MVLAVGNSIVSEPSSDLESFLASSSKLREDAETFKAKKKAVIKENHGKNNIDDPITPLSSYARYCSLHLCPYKPTCGDNSLFRQQSCYRQWVRLHRGSLELRR